MRTPSGLALLVLALVVGAASTAVAHNGSLPIGRTGTDFVAESALLDGLGAGALYPFLDSTPRAIKQAHIAITDATDSCSPGASAPENIVILAGEAGVALEPVMGAATNTGIGSADQCVFHVTVLPGQNGVPSRVTDIVVVNSGASALTGYQTVTVSATVGN